VLIKFTIPQPNVTAAKTAKVYTFSPPDSTTVCLTYVAIY